MMLERYLLVVCGFLFSISTVLACGYSPDDSSGAGYPEAASLAAGDVLHVISADPAQGIVASYARGDLRLNISSIRQDGEVVSMMRDGSGQEITQVRFRSDFLESTLTDEEYSQALARAQQVLGKRLDEQRTVESLLAGYQGATEVLDAELPAAVRDSVFAFALRLHLGLLRKVAVRHHERYRPVIEGMARSESRKKQVFPNDTKVPSTSLLDNEFEDSGEFGGMWCYEGDGGWDDEWDPYFIDETEDWSGGWGYDGWADIAVPSCDRNECGGMCGEDIGCCGNYSGCCMFSSWICQWHDEICECCDHWYCGWQCKSEESCGP